MGDIIYDTSFYNTLEAAVNDFRKALTKRWREETVKTIRYSNDYVTTPFRRTQRTVPMATPIPRSRNWPSSAKGA